MFLLSLLINLMCPFWIKVLILLMVVYIKCMCSDQMHTESENAEQCGTTTANQNIFDV